MLLKLSDYSGYYWLLASLRAILVFIPHWGYIHPDEFFQSIEILSGKIIGLDYTAPWEFKTTLPIRSVAFPYFTIGLIYHILHLTSMFLRDINVINTYTLVVLPRLLICCLSFFVDFSLYKICLNNNEKYKSRMILLASSYIIIIFGTRTFSNTLELILFAFLLYYVSESLVFSNILTRQKEFLNYQYQSSRTPAERATFHKYKLFLTSDSLRNCWQISTITVLGFFNRPTFVAFAIFPVFFWLYRGLGSKLTVKLNFHLRIFIFILCCIPITLFVVIVDSFFYGYLTWGEIGMFDISINNFVFTPLNFIKYNLNEKNLAKHGLHPRYLHVLVNIPLLFNVLGLNGFYVLFQHLRNGIGGKFHLLPTMRSIRGMMTLSILAPVIILSIFPHQEPRFLIPVLLPVIYLFSNSILPESETIIIKSENTTQQNSQMKKSSFYLFKLWLISNSLFVIFYGFIHQAGLYPMASYLSNAIKGNTAFNYHIITSHTYSMPESFLVQKSTKWNKKDNITDVINKKVFVHNEGSIDFQRILKKFHFIETNKSQKTDDTIYYLIIPNSVEDELFFQTTGFNISFIEILTYYPHLSVEALPDLSLYCLHLFSFHKNCNQYNTLSVFNYLHKFFTSFGLKLYQFKFV